MKRKNSIFNNPLTPILRPSPLRSFHGSKFQFPCSISTPQAHGDHDSSCKKRVKIKDRDRRSTCRRDASPIPLKQRLVTQSNDAKTSEFAFFKKFKEDAGHRFNPSPMHQKKLQSKRFKSSNCFRERTSPIKNSCKDFTSHFLVENVTPVNYDPMHSPLGNSSKISEVDVKQAHTTLEGIQSKHRNMENNGTLHSHSDIFSRKRQKLRQFVENMSHCGTGESYEKGYGFVSMLLSRLIPESNQNGFDDNFEKRQKFPERSFARVEYGHYLDNSSSPCQLNKSRGRVLSHSDYPTNSDDKYFHLKYRTMESDCNLEENITLLDASDASFTAAMEKYRSLMFSQYKPLDGLYYKDVQLRKQEPKTFLLGWDIDNIKNESSLSSPLLDLNTSAMHPTSFSDDLQSNLRENFGAVGLCSSPFPSRNSRNVYSLPCSSSTTYQFNGSSIYDVVKKEDIAAYFNNIHLNFSNVPKYPCQCDIYIDQIGSGDFFCTQTGHWFMNSVLDGGNQHPYIKSLCASSSSSGFVFDFGWESLSGSREHCKAAYHSLEFPLDEVRQEVPVDEEVTYESSDIIFHKDWSSFVQPESFLRQVVCHILPDKLIWDADQSEIDLDKTEMNYI